MAPLPARSPARGMAVLLLGCLGLIVTYGVVTWLLWANRDFEDAGPLGFRAPAAGAPLDPNGSLDVIRRQCLAAGGFSVGPGDSVKIVAARYHGRAYYACYQVSDGQVFEAAAIDADGMSAPNSVVKRLGAWPYIGPVKSVTDLVMGGVALVVLLAMYFLYYRRARPGPPVSARWWQTPVANALLGTIGILPLTLPFRGSETRARRMRLLYRFGFGWAIAITCVLLLDTASDRTGIITLGLIGAGELFGWIGGRILLRPAGFGLPDGTGTALAGRPGASAAWAVEQVPAGSPGGDRPLLGDGTAAGNGTAGGDRPGVPAGVVPRPALRAGRSAPSAQYVRPPTGLPTFTDVGGMQQLKEELSDTVGLMLAYGNEADRYKIRFNGILLHGPPGVGKTFTARATAGEFGMHFAHISTGNLVSKYVGESATNLRQVFAEGARHVPCLLFFDEFDSIAERRDSGLGEESKRLVNQLLQSLEEWRTVRELIIMAATNHLDDLDPAVVRPGRFDRLIRVDLPDLNARRSILAAQLAGRPTASEVNLDDLAERMAGRTPATIAQVVEAASMAAFRRLTAEAGAPSPIQHQDLRTALAGLGGTDRPTVESWSWDRLILPETMTAELRQVQALVSDPDRANAYGVEVPSGLLLAGPPGTGKTTIARVFAAEGGFSFYPVTTSDLTSKWVGESEATVVRLFERARANAPAIIFIDEIDAIAGIRAQTGTSYLDRTLTQLLTEIDGMVDQPGVFVMAATNRPDVLDPALLRGGRLSRTITLPLPDRSGRLQMLRIFTARMPLHNVNLDGLAGQTEGFSGADLEALCQQAAMNAMLAAGTSPGTSRAVPPEAFAGALRESKQNPRISDAAGDAAGFGDYL